MLYSYGRHFLLAIKIKNGYLLNGDKYSASTGKHQAYTRNLCSTKYVEIPLSALTRANIRNREKIEILDIQEATYETKTRKDKDGKLVEYQIHHLGASLIKYKRRYFLSGIDPSGNSWNTYFLIELIKPVSTVNDAFRGLASNLTDTEYNQYLEGTIKRQGEYFLRPFRTATLNNKKINKFLKDRSKNKSVCANINEYIESIHKKSDIIDKLKSIKKDYNSADEDVKKYHLQDKLLEVTYRNIQYIIEFKHKDYIKDLPKNFKIRNSKIYIVPVNGITKKFDISKGVGNKHAASEYIKTDIGEFIRGTLRHREHKMLSLGKKWHKIIKNTQKN